MTTTRVVYFIQIQILYAAGQHGKTALAKAIAEKQNKTNKQQQKTEGEKKKREKKEQNLKKKKRRKKKGKRKKEKKHVEGLEKMKVNGPGMQKLGYTKEITGSGKSMKNDDEWTGNVEIRTQKK